MAIAGHQRITFRATKLYAENAWQLRRAWMGFECATLPPICHQLRLSFPWKPDSDRLVPKKTFTLPRKRL